MVTFCCGASVGEGTFLAGLAEVVAMVVRGGMREGSVYVWVVIVIPSRMASEMTFSLALAMALCGMQEPES